MEVYKNFSVADRFKANDLAREIFLPAHNSRLFDTDTAKTLIQLVPAQAVRHFDSRIDWRRDTGKDDAKHAITGLSAGFGLVTIQAPSEHTDGTKRYGLEALPWVRAGDFNILNVRTKKEGRVYARPFFREKNDPLNIGNYKMLEYDPLDNAPLGLYAGDLVWKKSANKMSFQHDYRLIGVPESAPESFYYQSIKRDVEKSVKYGFSIYFALMTGACAATWYQAVKNPPLEKPAPAAHEIRPPAFP